MKLRIFCFSLLFCVVARAGGHQWQGAIPKAAQDPNKWHELVEKLTENHFYYGSLSAASRMLIFFQDLPSKELAYKTIIGLIDEGYPFSAKAYFSTGDIEPSDGFNFVNSYNLYKGIIAKEKGLAQWAEHYFANVEKDKFPKFLLYDAFNQYQKGDLDAAEKDLRKILALNLGTDQASLVKKTARTLARIYFEREQYEKSYDVYNTFLLRVNPMNPSDWLEAAWNLYYLKKFDQALGMLFNLEAPSSEGLIDLEKYELRALIYQGLCDTGRMQQLSKTFENDFGATITAIKSGEPLQKMATLHKLYHPANAAYYQNLTSLQELEAENEKISDLPGSLRDLAHYLYSTEIAMLKRKITSYTEAALNNAATHLITLSENLRFLKFDVTREQFNPDTIFQDRKPTSYVAEGANQAFEVHWVQMGDFWRDERDLYKAVVKNRCGEEMPTPGAPPKPSED